MTRDQFIARYAVASSLTVKQLAEHRLYAAPCNCDEPGCRGWKMVVVPEGYDLCERCDGDGCPWCLDRGILPA
jgi:hypothetical protein